MEGCRKYLALIDENNQEAKEYGICKAVPDDVRKEIEKRCDEEPGVNWVTIRIPLFNRAPKGR